jgi:hypothetical protein
MSSLLNSLRSSSSRHSDEHGVAELLEAVSRRTMSCTDEEKQELGNMVKRVREHNHKPNAVEILQKKLSNIHIGGNNNSIAQVERSNDMTSPNNNNRPKVGVGVIPNIGSPLNNLGKDIARGFSKLQTQLSQTNIMSPLTDRRDVAARPQPSSSPKQAQQEAQEPGLLRDFGAQPTIAVLPPLNDDDEDEVSAPQPEKDSPSLVESSDANDATETDQEEVVEPAVDCDSTKSDVVSPEIQDEAIEGTDEVLREEEKKQDL